jgi:hypothetical protein
LKYFLFMNTQPLHYDCSIITDLLKRRMTGIVISLFAYPQYHDIHPCLHRYSWISNVTNPYLAHLMLASACCPALVAAAQQWRPQHSGQAGFLSAGGPAVLYVHTLPAPLFRSEHGGSPSEAADHSFYLCQLQDLCASLVGIFIDPNASSLKNRPLV